MVFAKSPARRKTAGKTTVICALKESDVTTFTDKEMIKEIKELITSNSEKPVLFIMVGRNDFSEGISEYYSFLQWCNSEKTIQIDK